MDGALVTREPPSHADVEALAPGETLRLAEATRAFVRKLAGEDDEHFDAKAELSALLLERLRDATCRLEAELVVLVIPHCAYHDYPDARRIELNDQLEAAEADGSSPYLANGHWSERGHGLAARLTVAALP